MKNLRLSEGDFVQAFRTYFILVSTLHVGEVMSRETTEERAPKLKANPPSTKNRSLIDTQEQAERGLRLTS